MNHQLSFLSNADPSYLDRLYQQYLENPQSLEPDWLSFFHGYHLNQTEEVAAVFPPGQGSWNPKELKVLQWMEAFRNRAHLISDTNPIRKRKDRSPNLDLKDFQLEESDLEQNFQAATLMGLTKTSLRNITQLFHEIYAGKIGYEMQHIRSTYKREWLIEHIECARPSHHFDLELDEKRRILEKLNGATIFEKFLHTKYVGQKRFSLEGGESTIPALDAIIDWSGQNGAEEIIIGMAHRGRLNVLANVVGKTYEQIFSEFEGTSVPDLSFGSGDVKYHLGYSSQIKLSNNQTLQIKLAPNPSHLEAVDPVVTGLARAKADLMYQSNYDKILPILIHGDAAIAGQGIVYETVQMSKLDGYYVGGTIHLVINNQIGFTTDFDDARSSTYCTAAAYLVEAPIFHVNGDDPEAVVFVSKLAAKYRKEFNEDVFIDLVCYRKHGHNEGDDPKFTQPQLYEVINNHSGVRELYIKQLTARGDIEAELAKSMEQAFWNLLQERLKMVKEQALPYKYQEPELAWKSLKKTNGPEDFHKSPETGLELDRLKSIFQKTIKIPTGFTPLPKVEKLLKTWNEHFRESKIDWAMSESLAYSSLLHENKNVRISGQDVKRGTFSHRHAVLRDALTDQAFNRLEFSEPGIGHFFIYNSLLSEYAVLGFEYGYSLASPDHLVIWEAQFGDFSNGAQVVIDQFISSAQSKWNRMSGLVMLLPHGYDGQGPEHSSARLERFLQSCADFNMIVANVTTPANFFHLIRRQLHLNFRKPMVLMSPKSLLRHPQCISTVDAFGPGTGFQELMIDLPIDSKQKIEKVLVCSGQIYYDLMKARDDEQHMGVLIVRLEQLYPFPEADMKPLMETYKKCRWMWVQEEPRNMGAADFITKQITNVPLHIVSRPASAAPAVGHKKIHDLQLQQIIKEAFL